MRTAYGSDVAAVNHFAQAVFSRGDGMPFGILGTLDERAVGGGVADLCARVDRELGTVVVARGLHDLEHGGIAAFNAVGVVLHGAEFPAPALVGVARKDLSLLHGDVTDDVTDIAIRDGMVRLARERQGLVIEGMPVGGADRDVQAGRRNDDLAVFDGALADDHAVVDGTAEAAERLGLPVVDEPLHLGKNRRVLGGRLHDHAVGRVACHRHAAHRHGETDRCCGLADGPE